MGLMKLKPWAPAPPASGGGYGVDGVRVRDWGGKEKISCSLNSYLVWITTGSGQPSQTEDGHR